MSAQDLTQYFERLRAQTEREIKYINLAREIVEEMEYELDDIPNAVSMFTQAVEEASYLNARIGGDAYKPYDPDLAFPTKDVLKPILQRELQRNGVKIRKQKAFKF